MKKAICIVFLIIAFSHIQAQQFHLQEAQPDAVYDNVCSKKIYSDSLTTTFVIWVKKEVPLHKHASHTEQVIVLAGTASMLVGGEWKDIIPGDVIFIPIGTPHAVKVTSTIPLKVLSIQSPIFDGSDRILLND